MKYLMPLLLVLTGCGKPPVMPDTSPAIILAGQSNAQFFEVNGIQPDLQADWGEDAPEIINCGIGGAAIGWLSSGDNMAKCAARVGAHKVIGIIYYQGEADARTCTPDYGDQVVSLMQQFRVRYGLVPVVIAQLAINTNPPEYPCWNTIKTEQANIQLELSQMVITEDAATEYGVVDNVHLTPDAERMVGARFISALKTLLNWPQ